jgi:hypothetical protein
LTGGGEVIIGGEYRGQGDLPAASRTFVDSTSAINADALHEGDGGTVILWADGDTQFYGDISARGGEAMGDGGFAEVSGTENLTFQGTVDAGATNGANGTLLLDPENIVIAEGGGGNNLPNEVDGGDGQIIQIFQGDPPAEFTIFEEVLENIPSNIDILLEATNNITIKSLAGDGDGEDIDKTLLLKAGDGAGGSITFRADADGDGNGAFTMEPSDTIVARQRNIEISGAEITVGSINTSVPISEKENPDPGNGGSITLRATGDITTRGAFDGNSTDDDDPNPDFIPVALGSFVSVGRTGSGGRIEITSDNGTIDTTSGAVVSTAPDGAGGDVVISAENDVRTSDVETFIGVDDGGSGTSGKIEITSKAGKVDTRGGDINAFSIDGKGGDIIINANLNIFTGNVLSRVSGAGDAGNIEITSTNGIVNTTAGDLNANSSDGDGGAVTIRANSNALTGDISSNVFGIGNAGNIEITSTNRIVNTTAGNLNTSSSDGDGGTVTIQADSSVSTGFISSSTFGTGNAGKIEIKSTNGIVDTTENFIFSTAINGSGGGVYIEAKQDVTTGFIGTSSGPGGLGDIELISKEGDVDTTSGSLDGDEIQLRASKTVTFDDVQGSSLTASGAQVIHVGGFDSEIDVEQFADFVSTEGGVTLDRISADSLKVTSAGEIISSDTLTINNNANFTSKIANAGTVELVSQEDLTFDNSVIGGNLIVDLDGETDQIGVLQVAGDIVVNGIKNDGVDDPLTNTVGIPEQETTLDDGTVRIVKVGTIPLEAANYEAGLEVISLPRVFVGFDEALTDTAIKLTDPENSFGTVSFETAVSENSDAIVATPGITQTGPITVADTAYFKATDEGNISLTDPDNQFNGGVEFIGSDVDLASSAELELLDSNASGDLSIVSKGTIRQAAEASLEIQGNTDLIVTGLELGNVTLKNSFTFPVTEIGQSIIGGNFDLNIAGAPLFFPLPIARSADGTTLQVAGNFTLNGQLNPPGFERDILPTDPYQTDIDGNIFITDIGPTNVTEILDENGVTEVAGDLTVNSRESGLRFDDKFDQKVAIDFNGKNSLVGPITIQTDAPTVVEDMGESAIIQSAPLTVNGTATFNATMGTVNLPEATNQFGTIAFAGNTVTIQEQGDSRLGESVVTGTLDFTSGGGITQVEDLRVDGPVVFTSLEPDASITLDRNNQLAGPISFNTTGDGAVALKNTVVETQLAGAQIGGDFDVNSGADITQTAPLTVNGLTTLNSGGNDINLQLNNDFDRVAVTGSGNVFLRDVNNVTVADSLSFGDFAVTAQGDIASQNISISNGSIQLDQSRY